MGKKSRKKTQIAKKKVTGKRGSYSNLCRMPIDVVT